MKTNTRIRIKGIALLAALVFAISGFGQSAYRTGIGIRAGGTSGITIKQFIGGSSAIEGIVGIWSRGLSATVMYEKYAPAGASGLNWYYGIGGHVAFQTWDRYHDDHWYGRRGRYFDDGDVGLGIDGILGIEYKIPPIPMAISFDLKPFLEINTRGGAWVALDPGLGIKVAL